MKHDHHIPIVDVDCIKLCRCLAICLEIIRKTTSVKIDNVRLFARLFDRLRLKLFKNPERFGIAVLRSRGAIYPRDLMWGL